MNALTRFERLDDWLSDPTADLFRRMVRSMDVPGLRTPSEIKVDLTENDKAYQIKAEIPGAKREDVKVTVNGNYVTIDAEIDEEKETRGKDDRSLLRELYYGRVSRGFTLGQDVDDEHAQAKFENGILSLTLPKREHARQKQLKIG